MPEKKSYCLNNVPLNYAPNIFKQGNLLKKIINCVLSQAITAIFKPLLGKALHG